MARRRIVKLAGVDKAFQESIKKNLEVKFLNFMISKYFLDLIPSTWPLKKKKNPEEPTLKRKRSHAE